MKTSLLITAIFLFSVFASAQSKIKGNGNKTSIQRSTSSYDNIACSGSFDYVLVNGAEGNLTIEGEENLLKYIITEVKNNTLTITTERAVSLNPSNNETIKIIIPFEDIEEVSLAGSGDLWNEAIITGNKLNVSLSGSGDVTLDTEATFVTAQLTGSGDVTLSGKTDHLETTITGSGDFNSFNLKAQTVEASVTGSGDADIMVVEKLKATVTGSGEINYKGNPDIKNTKISGSGSIDGL